MKENNNADNAKFSDSESTAPAPVDPSVKEIEKKQKQYNKELQHEIKKMK